MRVVFAGPQRMTTDHKVLLSCTVNIIGALTWQSGIIWHNNQFLQNIIASFYFCVATLNCHLILTATRDLECVLQTYLTAF